MSSIEHQIQNVSVERQELGLRWDVARNTDLLNLLTLTLPTLLNAERCGIFVLDSERNELWLEAGTAVTQRQICVDLSKSMVGECVRTGKAINRAGLHNTEGSHRMVGDALSYEVSTALTVPINSGAGDVVGVLQVLNRKDGQPFDAADHQRLRELSYTVQPSVERMHAHRGLMQRTVDLDRRMQILLERFEMLRPGHSFRTFEPVKQAHSEGFLHHRWNGKLYPPFIDQQATAYLQQTWDTQPNDVIIATHQKVGTHLAKKFLVELVRNNINLSDRHPMAEGDIGHGAVPWPEVLLSQELQASWDKFMAATSDCMRLWYIHCAVEDLPSRRIHPNTKFVVAIRDPRAAAVSQYFFWIRHPLLKVDPDLTLDDFVKLFIDGDLYFGPYHQHVKDWVEPQGRLRSEQVCVLRYEEMVLEKLQVAERLQNFLFPGNELETDKLAEIAASTDFQTMKKTISDQPGTFHLDPKIYFRAGKTDDWRRHLSTESNRLLIDTTLERWDGLQEHPAIAPYLVSMREEREAS